MLVSEEILGRVRWPGTDCIVLIDLESCPHASRIDLIPSNIALIGILGKTHFLSYFKFPYPVILTSTTYRLTMPYLLATLKPYITTDQKIFIVSKDEEATKGMQKLGISVVPISHLFQEQLPALVD
jgi:hypothetical protein